MKKTFLVNLFFLAFLILGMCIYKDYGVSWDEPIQRSYGLDVSKYLSRESEHLLKNKDRYYGPFFELFLIKSEQIVSPNSLLQTYQLRHALTFVTFWLGTVFFYKLLLLVFKHQGTAVLGVLMLILTPRIFAHAFYNSKDIPVLVFFIVSTFYTFKAASNKSWLYIVLAAVSAGMATDIRVVGVLLPALAILIFKRAGMRYYIVYLCVFCLSLFIFWPTLWHSPVREFKLALEQASNYPQSTGFLFFGQHVESTSVPWYYILGWILVTTPIIYSMFFVIGNFGRPTNNKFYFLLWFWLPVIAVVVLHSTLYDGWRQMFFIYPAFIVLALFGVQRFKYGKHLMVINILLVALTMYKIHPFENVYFNLPTVVSSSVAQSFIIDYWGNSYKQLYDQLGVLDTSPNLHIYTDTLPAETNMLTSQYADRLVLDRDITQADYYVTNFRTGLDTSAYTPLYTIVVQNYPVSAIYKLK